MRRPRKPVPPNTVTVRPFVATMTQIRQSFSLLVVEGPIRAIEQPINLARHDEIVLMQSFDLLGAQRDSSMAPADADGQSTKRRAHSLRFLLIDHEKENVTCPSSFVCSMMILSMDTRSPIRGMIFRSSTTIPMVRPSPLPKR